MILEKTCELRLQDVPQTLTEYYASVPFQQDCIHIHQLYRGAMQQAAAQLDILDDAFTSVRMLNFDGLSYLQCFELHIISMKPGADDLLRDIFGGN